MKSAAFLFWLFLLFMTCVIESGAATADRIAEWKSVDAALKEGLPRTALERLEPIIKRSLEDKDYSDAARAIARRIIIESEIEGNRPAERVRLAEVAAAEAPPEIRPILQTLRAWWLWQFYQQNRWRILERTATEETPGDDIEAWDLPRIMAEVAAAFGAALENAEALQAVPVGDFREFLEWGSLPDNFRPTLYDVIAYEAIDFFTSAEQVTALAQDAFLLQADSPALDGSEEFLAWVPETGDPGAGDYRAVRLFQDVMRFHRNDEEPTAFLDADLARITWAVGAAAGESANERGGAALEAFANQYAAHELSSLALHTLAETFEEDDPGLAHAIALRGANAFPESRFGKLCLNLAKRIEMPRLEIEAERVWNAAGPEFSATYRNLEEVHFRIIPVEWIESGRSERYHNPEIPHGDALDALLVKKPAREWKEALEPTPDFRERTARFVPPNDLSPGFYLLVASARPTFSKEDNQVRVTTVWVSDLAVITRPSVEGIDGFVLDAVSGNPIADATVTFWPHDNRGRLHQTATAKTDKDGFFELKPRQGEHRRNGFVHANATIGGKPHALASMNQEAALPPPHNPDPHRVFFFTDRAIYRPGQAIRFKGIALHADPEKDVYHAIADQKYRIRFSDPNGKEIEVVELTSNTRGGISGVFTAPKDRVTGQMTIEALGLRDSATTVNVEEYKRPRFFTELAPPSDPALLGEVVRLRGVATTYADAPVDGSKVAWRVTRKVEWPTWFRFFQPNQGEAQEIAHGTAATEADGSFEIEFIARPDPSADPKNEPVFSYQVSADVTDSAGETRSARQLVQVGFTALRAQLSVDEWQVQGEPVELTVSLTSLDGEPRDGKGTVRIYHLRYPEKVHRPSLGSTPYRTPADERSPDLSDPENWELGQEVEQHPFSTKDGIAKLQANLGSGFYRAVVETHDDADNPATSRALVRIVDPESEQLGVPVPHLLVAESWRAEPEQTFIGIWGTGYHSGRAFVEILRNREVLERFWTGEKATQQRIEIPITESMRGGITLRITSVRENRAELESRQIQVPWTNKDLTVKWECFTSKLMPGATEKWAATITGPDAESAVAEMVATLYDASLDQFLKHGWMDGFPVFRREQHLASGRFQNDLRRLSQGFGAFRFEAPSLAISRTQFPSSLTGKHFLGFDGMTMAGYGVGTGLRRNAMPTLGVVAAPASARMESDTFAMEVSAPAEQEVPPPTTIDPSSVTARVNLEETAFFFPDLISGDDGRVRMEFTMPEALTTWRFLGFAHDADLRAGLLEGEVITAKDLMVQPNPPRFLREGDVIEFTVKITNRSDRVQSGTARLNFFDAQTNDSADAALGIDASDQAFEVPPNASSTFSWRIAVPDGTGFLTYRAVAATEALSDGEEGWLPVLPRRILVTESLPLPIRGPATREFTFQKLIDSGDSETLQSQGLVVQMTSNPAWYAVMALPYLMEFPYQCNEQIFNRLYANSLGRHIAKSDPLIRRVFDAWRGTDALDSPLEKNEDIKGILLEETPWFRQAMNESLARRNVGILFEDARMDAEIARTFQQLREAQYPDGTWPWFPGGRGDDFITLYITSGFARLRHLGAYVQTDLANRALDRLDTWIVERYRDLKRRNDNWKNHVPAPIEALYLYTRSFFLKDKPIPDASREAIDFYLGQGRQFWLTTGSRMTQGHLALALHRWGDKKTPAAILASLKERSVSNEEMGMFWKDSGSSWWWNRAPIETQALLIEAFDEIADDADVVEACRVWLLKQKQTQDWKTTKATADAVYALLLRGTDILTRTELVDVRLDGESITPDSTIPLDSADAHPDVEAGTGTFERRFGPDEIRPELGRITLTKNDEGVAWGGVHWQYLEDIANITPHEETPLHLTKTIFLRENTERGPVLRPIDGALAPGDELVVRIELRTDRAMEYIHLKDQRGSGAEPVNVLSGRRQQDGLSYYESTRDTASHFFIDYLPEGTYVFEYPVRVQLRGDYQSGIAEVMSMYAPEFNSHSASTALEVR